MPILRFIVIGVSNGNITDELSLVRDSHKPSSKFGESLDGIEAIFFYKLFFGWRLFLHRIILRFVGIFYIPSFFVITIIFGRIIIDRRIGLLLLVFIIFIYREVVFRITTYRIAIFPIVCITPRTPNVCGTGCSFLGYDGGDSAIVVKRI